MAKPAQYRILPNNGSGWYWEVVTQDREVISRGIANTNVQARTDAMTAALDQRLKPQNGSALRPGLYGFAGDTRRPIHTDIMGSTVTTAHPMSGIEIFELVTGFEPATNQKAG